MVLKDNYDQCLTGIRTVVQAAKSDTDLNSTEIAAFTNHLDQYSRELLKIKQWSPVAEEVQP